MRLAITGANGRMGKELVKASASHSVCKITLDDNIQSYSNDFDTVIDFTTPESSMEFARFCEKHNKSIVIGTTGFSNAQVAELERVSQNIPLLWSSNMSLGINLLLKLSQDSAKILGDGYDVEIIEAHHRNKVDAPSGTALMVGKAIAEVRGKNIDDIKDLNRQLEVRARKDGSIGFSSIRAGNLFGSLNVMFANDSEIIELKHQSMDRSVYANGAIKAASWLQNKQPGKLYHTLDVFDYL